MNNNIIVEQKQTVRSSNNQLTKTKIPVLMYHSIIPDSDVSVTKQNRTCVTISKFQNDMIELKRAGYTTIFLKDYETLRNSNTLPDKPIVITFDDGYSNNYTYAFQVLKSLQMKATIFIIGKAVTESPNTPRLDMEKYIKRTNDELLGFDTELLRSDFPFLENNTKINWTQIKEMVNSGFINIQHHTWDLHKQNYDVNQAKSVDYLRKPRVVGFRISYTRRLSNRRTRVFLPSDLFSANRNLTPNEVQSLRSNLNGTPITIIRSNFYNSEVIKLKAVGSLVVPQNGTQPYIEVQNINGTEYIGTLIGLQCIYFDNILDQEIVYERTRDKYGNIISETSSLQTFYDPLGVTTFGTPAEKNETLNQYTTRINNDFNIFKNKILSELGSGYQLNAFSYPNGLNIEPGSRGRRIGPSYLPIEDEYSNTRNGIKYMVLASSIDEGIWDTEKIIMHNGKNKNFLRIPRINVDQGIGGRELVRKLENLLKAFTR